MLSLYYFSIEYTRLSACVHLSDPVHWIYVIFVNKLEPHQDLVLLKDGLDLQKHCQSANHLCLSSINFCPFEFHPLQYLTKAGVLNSCGIGINNKFLCFVMFLNYCTPVLKHSAFGLCGFNTMDRWVKTITKHSNMPFLPIF